MTRSVAHVVPPVPQGLKPDEMKAFRLWRQGLCIREAAREAGISHSVLFRIVFPLIQEVV